MIGLNIVSLALYLIMFLVGLMFGAGLLFMYIRVKVPGLGTWIMASMKNLPVVLSSYMDGYAEYKVMKKESGSLIFNGDTTEEFIDRSMIDKKPMASLHGHRIMYRVTASAVPNSPDELSDIQRVLDHIDENQDQYPLLSKLQEYEIFGAIGHDPQTVRELLAVRCQVEKEYIVNDKVEERDPEAIKFDVAKGVEAYMLEVDRLKRNLKFLPRQSVFVDLARCVDATQLRIASQILKRYRAEIEALYRARYGGIENSIWKGALIGGAVGLMAGAIGVKLIAGV
jgi:hypothetical protein